MMDIDLNNLPTFQIQEYRFDAWFEKIQPNGLQLNESQRQELIQMIDYDVAINNGFINHIITSLQESGDEESEYNTINRALLNAWLFTALTTADCMVACKYFLLADTDYDRRYMRGKLKVIMNEGIKKLVGFKADKKDEKVWTSISGIMKHFPGSVFQQQFADLDLRLRECINQSSWWKTERDAETHLDPIAVISTRQEDLDESTVMLESIQLIGAVDAVNHFLQNLHAGLTNWLNDLYRKHPEKFK